MQNGVEISHISPTIVYPVRNDTTVSSNYTIDVHLPDLLDSDESETHTCNYTRAQPTHTNTTTSPNIPAIVADSGASGIFLRACDAATIGVTNVLSSAQTPQPVVLPDGTTIYSHSTGHLHIQGTDLVLLVYIFSDDVLATSLCGLSPLTAKGCTIQLEDSLIKVSYKGRVVLEGPKRKIDKLWPMPLPVMARHGTGNSATTRA
jgi:hypothetical protein